MTKPWYRKSLADLEADAKSGDGHAMALHAQAYLRGLRGAELDKEQACALLEKAAAAGSGVAARWLGDHFFRERDDAETARTWWRRAADLGDADAMSNLLDGSGSDEELRLLVKAAELGQPYARTELKARQEGNPRTKATLLDLATKPLTDYAEEGDDDGIDVSFTARGSEAKLNELFGRWAEGVAAVWPALVVETDSDGEPADFPAPEPANVSWDDVTVLLRSGCRVLRAELDYDEDDEEWSLSVMSESPHPEPAEAEKLLGALKAAAKETGLKLKAD